MSNCDFEGRNYVSDKFGSPKFVNDSMGKGVLIMEVCECNSEENEVAVFDQWSTYLNQYINKKMSLNLIFILLFKLSGSYY